MFVCLPTLLPWIRNKTIGEFLAKSCQTIGVSVAIDATIFVQDLNTSKTHGRNVFLTSYFRRSVLAPMSSVLFSVAKTSGIKKWKDLGKKQCYAEMYEFYFTGRYFSPSRIFLRLWLESWCLSRSRSEVLNINSVLFYPRSECILGKNRSSKKYWLI